MNIKIQPKIHNRFDIYKKNVVTGKEKQVGYAENIVLNQMWSRLCSGSTYFVNIHYGTGTGMLDPTRTSLFTHLGTAAASNVETVRAIPTSHWRRSITLGLTTANGSELTEVGVAYGLTPSYLVTHAQIRDMNGNVISILKTDVDIITIYATVYITMVNTDANIKLLAPDYNDLLSYLLGGSFPSAVFYAGMSDLAIDNPVGLMSYTLGTSPTGSWSNDVANKKRTTSTMRFGTTTANGHIKELVMSNIARLLLPASGIYSGLELSGVPIGIGDGETTVYDLPSAYVDQTSLVVKVVGTITSVTKSDRLLAYKRANVTGGNPIGNGYDVSFSPDGTIMAMAHIFSPYIMMYKDIDGVWTKMANVTGGYPAGVAHGVSFSSDGTIMAVAHDSTPYITMYKDIEGVWTKMANVTGGNPTGNGRSVAFSSDGSIMAVAHYESPYITMYRDIEGVWTKMANVTGGYPAYRAYDVSFSSDGTIMAVAHESSPCITMYRDIEGVWTKMANVTGGYPTVRGYGVSFSSDGTIMAVAHYESPYIMMYKDIDGVWTKMANVTGGNPAGIAHGVSFSSDGTIMAVAHESSPYIMMYKDIDGVWTKMANVTGGYPDGASDAVSFSPDGSIMAVAHDSTPCITMYNIKDIMTQIEFSTAPAVGAVITADYTVLGIHKTDQRVIDISGEIQFGEPAL